METPHLFRFISILSPPHSLSSPHYTPLCLCSHWYTHTHHLLHPLILLGETASIFSKDLLLSLHPSARGSNHLLIYPHWVSCLPLWLHLSHGSSTASQHRLPPAKVSGLRRPRPSLLHFSLLSTKHRTSCVTDAQ